MADLDPHIHFSPMKSPESVGPEGVVSLLQVHLHQLTKGQDLPLHTDEYERGAHATSMRQMPTC